MVFAQEAPASPNKPAASPQIEQDKKSKGEDILKSEAFTDDVARYLLGEVRDGLEGYQLRRMLAAFDGDKMAAYSSFEDQVRAMYANYSEFRVHFRIVESTTESAKGIVLVNFQLEQIPSSPDAEPHRKSSQIRFEFARGEKGWRIVNLSPRAFFS